MVQLWINVSRHLSVLIISLWCLAWPITSHVQNVQRGERLVQYCVGMAAEASPGNNLGVSRYSVCLK